MMVTIFRSRLDPDAADEYAAWATRMSELAQTMPGYISHKVFVAEDGERVTLVEFESADTQRHWKMHPPHVEAQQKGRRDFYLEYKLQVCNVERESLFARPAAVALGRTAQEAIGPAE
jgi:heme-degrading monooxygenase HmoA